MGNTGSFQLRTFAAQPSTAHISIFDITGSLVYRQEIAVNGAGSYPIQLKAAKGMYWLKYENGKEVSVQKLVVYRS